ncbi:hypothetical protein B2G88_11325 [Natronolimnobius baerhuensis]|uniref:Uncharacterized protein n=1 Tax=Natronolimnobius baerhuensis TaxID=253108 RepID=A0A202EAC6_9EURY|nr:hypothetical protein B2G88_11325 [Natronolimnobius baerhuensis]
MTAVGGAAAASTVVPTTTTATASESPVTVRIYPGPVPLHGWLHAGVTGMRSDWPEPYRDAMAAVEESLDRVLEYANAESRLEGLEISLERGAPVRFPLSDAPLSSEAVVPSLSTVLANFREQVRERNALSARTSHVLFCWSPLNFRVGYGGTLTPNAELGSRAGDGDNEDNSADRDEHVDGALTVANLGATEIWDSRPITRNMAIHETLHTFLSPEVADEVGGSPCDHDLGTAVRTGEDGRTMEVTPMATAYAGPDELGGGTRFHGRGCHDHGEFHRHDGLENVDEWTYTTEPSQATLEAVTRYLERTV